MSEPIPPIPSTVVPPSEDEKPDAFNTLGFTRFAIAIHMKYPYNMRLFGYFKVCSCPGRHDAKILDSDIAFLSTKKLREFLQYHISKCQANFSHHPATNLYKYYTIQSLETLEILCHENIITSFWRLRWSS